MSSRAECTVMFRKLIAIWVLVGTMLVPALTRAAGPLELKSVRVDLPDEERMFTGPGADAINNNCLASRAANRPSARLRVRPHRSHDGKAPNCDEDHR